MVQSTKTMYARPALKARLIVLHGAEQGYSAWVQQELLKLTGRKFGGNYVNGVVSGGVRAYVPMMLALVRVVAHGVAAVLAAIREEKQHV